MKRSVVIRANFSTKVAPDLVDWHAYYLIETDGVSQLVNDRMNLRFYGRKQLEAFWNKPDSVSWRFFQDPSRIMKNTPPVCTLSRRRDNLAAS